MVNVVLRVVKIWQWNSIVQPGASNVTKFTCDAKCEIPGNGEHDNVSILITPSKPAPTPSATLSAPPSTSPMEVVSVVPEQVPESNDTFIIKRSGSLQIWDSVGNPGNSWSPEENPQTTDKKAKLNEDAIVIKDAKYSVCFWRN